MIQVRARLPRSGVARVNVTATASEQPEYISFAELEESLSVDGLQKWLAARGLPRTPQALSLWRQRGTGPRALRVGRRYFVYLLRDVESWWSTYVAPPTIKRGA